MNQFLNTFTSEVFSYVLDIIQIKECTTAKSLIVFIYS